MRDVVVLGVGQSQFGKLRESTVEQLGGEAATAALADAGIRGSDLQMAYTSRLYSEMITGQVVLKGIGVTAIEMVNVENACAGGSTAVHELYKSIAGGFCDVGLALGVESMTTSPVAGKLIPPAESDLDGQLGMTMPVVFALQARRLMETHGATEEDFARVSVKAHDAGALNPRAQYRARLTVEEVLASRVIADPIRLLECCPNTDGAAAVVLCSAQYAERIASSTPRVRIAASVLRSGDYFYKRRDLTSFTLGATTAALAYESAGVDPLDVDVVELHDAFASEEIVHYEDLQLCPVGDGVGLLRSGATSLGGRVPVNPSGGLLSLGHPLSASGVRVVADVTAQLRGTAGDVQVPGARVGVAQMLGGASAGIETGACAVQVLTV
ncbi:thiolase family protein [Georgenia sp. H159]|uniref:thiolase family protein n=1 Tax=Georgenia sp. H159 TaxID=3076115 RepID=UPI002D77C4B5|nr:thiolase family protein [Georgenia sp. H159]